MGIQRVILETDATTIVKAVISTEFDHCSAGGLVRELKTLLRYNFTSYDVVHIPRSCNSAADSFAALEATLSSGANPVVDSIL